MKRRRSRRCISNDEISSLEARRLKKKKLQEMYSITHCIFHCLPLELEQLKASGSRESRLPHLYCYSSRTETELCSSFSQRFSFPCRSFWEEEVCTCVSAGKKAKCPPLDIFSLDLLYLLTFRDLCVLSSHVVLSMTEH